MGVKGQSMLPTFAESNDLLLLDSFSIRVLGKKPEKGQVILASNPFKGGFRVRKRVMYTEGEIAEFTDP